MTFTDYELFLLWGAVIEKIKVTRREVEAGETLPADLDELQALKRKVHDMHEATASA